jgi:hypothetical protein
MRRTLSATAIVSFGLAFVFAGEATPAHADPIKCKATITKSASQYVQARTKALVKCEGAVVAGKLPQATDCNNELKTEAAIDKAKAKMEAAIEGVRRRDGMRRGGRRRLAVVDRLGHRHVSRHRVARLLDDHRELPRRGRVSRVHRAKRSIRP